MLLFFSSLQSFAFNCLIAVFRSILLFLLFFKITATTKKKKKKQKTRELGHWFRDTRPLDDDKFKRKWKMKWIFGQCTVTVPFFWLAGASGGIVFRFIERCEHYNQKESTGQGWTGGFSPPARHRRTSPCARVALSIYAGHKGRRWSIRVSLGIRDWLLSDWTSLPHSDETCRENTKRACTRPHGEMHTRTRWFNHQLYRYKGTYSSSDRNEAAAAAATAATRNAVQRVEGIPSELLCG